MKPPAVTRAQYALWAWTAWTCLFGLYESWSPNNATQEIMAQVQALAPMTPALLRNLAVGIYILVALSMVGVIMQIGAGRRWPRTLMLASFIFEVVWALGQGLPSPIDALGDVFDLGLLAYAMYLLYSSPGRDWFKPRSAAA